MTPEVLCVDDDPQVLRGLTLNLRKRFRVSTADGGAQALELLQARETPFAVILSDMRMPGMDGAELLRRAKELTPDTTRMLLTGQAALESAIAAINRGGIFRFLTKPCPPELLIEHLSEAAEQFRLRLAERELLEQTLRGSLSALGDVLAMSNPLAFGRALRVQKRAVQLAHKLGLESVWRIEVAALLSHLGSVCLAQDTLDKLYHGKPLTRAEAEQVEQLPAHADRILERIPRLEPVRELIARSRCPGEVADPVLRREAALLGAVVELERLEQQNVPKLALAELRKDPRWEREHVEALLELCCENVQTPVELPLRELSPGMVFADDVKTTDGTLLVAKGLEVTGSLLQRLLNREGLVAEPLRVLRS